MKIALAILVCLAVSVVSKPADKEEEASSKSDKLLHESTQLLKDVSGIDVRRAEIRERILAALGRLKKRIIRLHERIMKWFNDKPPSYIMLLHEFILRVLDRVQNRLNNPTKQNKSRRR